MLVADKYPRSALFSCQSGGELRYFLIEQVGPGDELGRARGWHSTAIESVDVDPAPSKRDDYRPTGRVWLSQVIDGARTKRDARRACEGAFE